VVLAVLKRDAERISLPARRQHCEALLRQPGPKRVFAAVRVCGIGVMVAGVAILLNR
jgi:hypothetical protein